MNRPPGLHLLGAVLVALLTLGALAAAPSASAGERADTATTGAPAVGECFDATRRQAWSASLAAPRVRCAADHTLRIIAVHAVPATADLTDIDDPAIDAVLPACKSTFGGLVGRDPRRRALTLYELYFFVPTAAQREAGARWVSCAAGLMTARGMPDLPTGRLPRATRTPADAVALCATTRAVVSCTRRHSHRAVHAYVVKVPRSTTRAARVVQRSAATRCTRRAGRSYLYLSVPHGPGRALVTCLRRTRR